MHSLFTLTIVTLFFFTVRAGDLAISAAIARDIVRVVFYGFVALLALIVLLLSLFVGR